MMEGGAAGAAGPQSRHFCPRPACGWPLASAGSTGGAGGHWESWGSRSPGGAVGTGRAGDAGGAGGAWDLPSVGAGCQRGWK